LDTVPDPGADGGERADVAWASATAQAVEVEWDGASISAARDHYPSHAYFHSDRLERAVRRLVREWIAASCAPDGILDPVRDVTAWRLTRIAVTDVEYVTPGDAVRLLVELRPGNGDDGELVGFREFWRMLPEGASGEGEDPWRVVERFRLRLNELRQPTGVPVYAGLDVFGTTNVSAAQWPPAEPPERRFLLSCGWTGGESGAHDRTEAVLVGGWVPSDPDAVTVLRKAAVYLAGEPDASGAGDAEPTGLRIVELLPPFPPMPDAEGPGFVEDRPRLLEGLPQVLRNPFRRRGALRQGTSAFAERYAEARGLDLGAEGESPHGTWTLDQVLPQRSHSFLRGALAYGVNGTMFFSEIAVMTPRGRLWEPYTLATTQVGTDDRLASGIVCTERYAAGRTPAALPTGFAEVSIGEAQTNARHVVAVADPAATAAARALFADGFAAWWARDWPEKASPRFELRGQTLCVYRRRTLTTAAELDDLRARTALLTKRLQAYVTWTGA
jgi:hypothetical protein